MLKGVVLLEEIMPVHCPDPPEADVQLMLVFVVVNCEVSKVPDWILAVVTRLVGDVTFTAPFEPVRLPPLWVMLLTLAVKVSPASLGGEVTRPVKVPLIVPWVGLV